jgi:GNAT superfamily N-acetyltransferase
VPVDSSRFRDELVFRDYLRRHRDVAREYGELKSRLAKRFEHDREAYTEAKAEFIRVTVGRDMARRSAIRRARPRERSAVVATVAAAFAEDPGWAYILGEEYERLVAHFVAALFDLRVASENVWVTEDLATVAMWDSPGEDDDAPTRAESVWTRYRAIAGEDAFERLAAYHDAVAAVSAFEPYWYLGVLATHPQRQREGLATAVLRPILDDADRRGIACCLETSTAGNRRFYERRGFTQATEIDLPGGPPTWWLRRAPKTITLA